MHTQFAGCVYASCPACSCDLRYAHRICPHGNYILCGSLLKLRWALSVWAMLVLLISTSLHLGMADSPITAKHQLINAILYTLGQINQLRETLGDPPEALEKFPPGRPLLVSVHCWCIVPSATSATLVPLWSILLVIGLRRFGSRRGNSSWR